MTIKKIAMKTGRVIAIFIDVLMCMTVFADIHAMAEII